MKALYIFFILLFFTTISNYSQEPTNAGIPDANRVLVVYNGNSSVSDSVKNYYRDARNIPSSNIVRLDSLVDKDVTIDGETHRVGLAQETDIIRDFHQHSVWAATPTKHAFKYFLDNISTPIRNWITSHNLTSTIRYIVLCKGVPFKIQSGGDWSGGVKGNLTVDGMLCMLNTPDYDSFILDSVLYNNGLPNPYFNADPNLSMDYRFLPDHFNDHGYNLSYLVSHLDGISFEVVKGIIDRSINPDMSGTATWIIDADPNGVSYGLYDAKVKLEELGFNVFYDYGDMWITSYPGKVMGYTSCGTHAEDGNCEWEDSAWVKDSLHFDLANGSVFNTFESFNGNSLTTLNWRYVHNDPSSNCNHTQGLATQFTEIGGTATMGHAWEPFGSEVVSNNIFFPAYQLGYNLVDAYYQGLRSLAWQNVLVGDPLTRIYDCTETIISQNTTIGSGNFTCDLVVEENATLTISRTAAVNFERNAKLIVYGNLILEEGVILDFNNYSKLYLEGNLAINGNNVHLNFNNASVFKAKNISIDNSVIITFNNESEIFIYENGSLITHSGNLFIFNNNSKCNVKGNLIVNAGNSLNFKDDAKITVYSKAYFNSGAIVNLYNNSSLTINGIIKSIGMPGNMVVFNFPNRGNSRFNIYNGDTVLIDFTKIQNGLDIRLEQIEPIKCFSITNSVFDQGIVALFIGLKQAAIGNSVYIANCEFNNISQTGIAISRVPQITIENNFINLVGLEPGVNTGIDLSNNGVVNIRNCEIAGGGYGIRAKTSNADEDEIEYINDLESDILIEQCEIKCNTGIYFDVNTALTPISALKIKNNQINECSNGININQFRSYVPEIKNNIITGLSTIVSEYGILLTNGREALLNQNNILNFITGISVNSVESPYILKNNISANDLKADPLSGVFFVSSNGEIRSNTIQGHRNGIELGSSSPNIGMNNITANKGYGLYISNNSNPNLSGQFVGGNQYPISGFNNIRANGICCIDPFFTELYLNNSYVNLEKGCNTIADDRGGPISCGNYLLIDGRESDKEIIAVRNYWGVLNGSDPSGRFSQSLNINYEDWLTEPCISYEGENILMLANTKGEVYDTVYSTGETPSELTDIQTRYAAANNYYYHNQYTQAKQEYEDIIQHYGNNTESIQAYNRLHTIAGLTNSSPTVFNQLKDFYLQQASNQTDSLMIGTLTHLGDLCFVSVEDYIPAINNFDEIAQQNPNTDIALYRQIDALTTSLLLPKDSTLNKGKLSKYSVNNLSDYTNKLSELLRTRGKSGLKTEEELLPTEYTLYQNYPNPFNPITTIKYDIPFASDVSLIIYDILGRKVKELVNTKQESGRYEVQFNALQLSSGVYVYRLITEKYISSKKMLLMK